MIGATEQRELRYGGRVVPYTLNFGPRKGLCITVYPDRRVAVRAPATMPRDEALAKVAQRAGWIVKHYDRFEGYQPPPPKPRYVSGETHWYLGRELRLIVTRAAQESIALAGSELRVTTPDRRGRGRVRRLVDAWYRDAATAYFDACLTRCGVVAAREGLPRPRYRLRRMRRRWASCSAHGLIVFNTELVKAPADGIEYVVMHELCHLRERNHGPRFKRLLSLLMPDWKARKALLDRVIVS